MIRNIEAIYENGVLKPLQPLSLQEREQVRITVMDEAEDGLLDVEFMDSCRDEGPEVSLEEVRAAMSKIAGSMSDAVDDDRGVY